MKKEKGKKKAFIFGVLKKTTAKKMQNDRQADIQYHLNREIPVFSIKMKLQYLLLVVLGCMLMFGLRLLHLQSVFIVFPTQLLPSSFLFRGGIIGGLIIWFGNRMALNNRASRNQNNQPNQALQGSFLEQMKNSFNFGAQQTQQQSKREGKRGDGKLMTLSDLNSK